MLTKAGALKQLIDQAHAYARSADLSYSTKNLSIFVNDAGGITVQSKGISGSQTIVLNEEDARVLAGFINNAYKPIEGNQLEETV